MSLTRKIKVSLKIERALHRSSVYFHHIITVLHRIASFQRSVVCRCSHHHHLWQWFWPIQWWYCSEQSSLISSTAERSLFVYRDTSCHVFCSSLVALDYWKVFWWLSHYHIIFKICTLGSFQKTKNNWFLEFSGPQKFRPFGPIFLENIYVQHSRENHIFQKYRLWIKLTNMDFMNAFGMTLLSLIFYSTGRRAP